MNATQYPDVNRLIGEILRGLQGVLGANLVGLYLDGSLVTGDFDEDISDVDLLAVLSGPLTDHDVAALGRMHEELARTYPEWDDRIEVVYLSIEGLRTCRSKSTRAAVVSPGEPFHVIDAGQEWLMNWYVVREQGVALFGPPPEAIIDPISPEEFRNAVREYILYGLKWQKDSRRSQAYAILTMCRGLYTVTKGQPASKRQAARWAEAELPQWRQLIHDALTWREGWRDESVDHAATQIQTDRFVNHVQACVSLR